MAKDLELEKSSPDSEESSVKKSAKGSGKSDAKGSKDDKKSKDKKSAKPKKKKGGPIKYFKDAKSEFKKVVWPTPKETTKNTVVVLAVCLIAGLFVFGMDSLFGLLNNLLFK